MMRFALIALALAIPTTALAGPFRNRRAQAAYAQPYYQTVTNTASTASTITTTTNSTSTTNTTTTSGDGLDEVNAKRASRGLRPLIRDDNLTIAARGCAEHRARHLLFGHTSNDFHF